MDGFIEWLNEWEEEVASKTISSEDSAKCLLSPATRDGWKITCKYVLTGTESILMHRAEVEC